MTYVVTIVLEGHYWSIQMLVGPANSPDEAMQMASAKFAQAVSLGYMKGEFQATEATPVA